MPGGRWSVLSDEELATYCVSKLDGAMEELLRRYERRIRACAEQMAADPTEVDDLVQETFLRVIASVARFEGHSAFGTWLYRLAHNTCVDNFRREIRQRAHQTGKDDQEALEQFLADSQPEDWGDPGTQLEHDLAACYVGWLLSTLSAQNRRVVQLRLLHGYSTEEVARAVGTTPDAVKSRLRRAGPNCGSPSKTAESARSAAIGTNRKRCPWNRRRGRQLLAAGPQHGRQQGLVEVPDHTHRAPDMTFVLPVPWPPADRSVRRR